MGGATSKQERHSSRRRIKVKSNEQIWRPTRKELDEKERVIVALKTAEKEWRKERKRLREEVKRLRLKMEEKEEAKAKQREWEWVVEQMCVERAVREEAVDRWKQLYFAIKNELDDLIQTTYGEALRQKPQEEVAKTVQELRKEVKVRGETIETLKGRIALMEKQRIGKEREVDLLRQSLRILGGSSGKNKKAPSSATRNLPVFKTKFIGCK
ncbi:PREDICTED: golgin subfamily A member 6-like protein 22 [Camelina sativa]|uniref:Golgin subfamily A member 6-like protein 22 n=1 Tax=Camelina sativa TaxID=90675 RepID=A0ABM0U3G7_CAMSA|nr:PREDICTED: golgin subfamily A member 6-like protein 22 [Camelina sativa]